jgi:hypothetical protein
MNTYCLFSILVCASRTSDGAVLRGQSTSLTLNFDASASEMEFEDRTFLYSQLDETESELVKLQDYLESWTNTGSLAGVQSSVTNKNATAEKLTNKTDTAPKNVHDTAEEITNKTHNAPKGVHAKTAATVAVDPAKLLASLGASKKLQGTAMLAPMLAMLKGMYEDSKNRISQVNAREDKSKKWFADKEAEHAKKVADIEEHFKNHKLSEELHTNETRDETRYFKYWSNVRERQHRQFHTNLKIQHAMMAKAKKMVEMYENTLSGKASDQAKVKKELGQAGEPEIVFLQEAQRAVVQFCKESFADLRNARAEMSEERLK